MQQKPLIRNTAPGYLQHYMFILYIGRKPIRKNRKENFELIKSGESRSDVCPLFFVSEWVRVNNELNVATEKMKIVTTFTDTEQLVRSGNRAENPDIFWMIMIENKWRAIVTK